MDGFATYEVTLISPLLDGPFIVECIASTPARAETRCRMAAFHTFQHEAMLKAECTTRVIEPEEEP